MKQQKGITLIALVITIIVLLILAGVTIAMLTGSDSAPVKANEAKQKQDIGAAKDQVYIWAQEYQTTAYENVYVKGKGANGTSDLATGSTNKANDIGDYVGENLASKNGQKVGLAEIAITASKGSDPTASITITTTDFKLEGQIDREAGTLTWSTAGIVTNE